MKYEFSAGVITFFKDPGTSHRLYLLLNYKKGYWDLPKGKLEPGETNMEAARRELKEESDLDADIFEGFQDTLSYTFRDKEGELIYKQVTFFVGESYTKSVSISDEHIGFIWLSIDEAVRLANYKNAKDMLSAADNFLNNLNI